MLVRVCDGHGELEISYQGDNRETLSFEVFLDEQYIILFTTLFTRNNTGDTVHMNNILFFEAKTRKVRDRIFEEEKVRVMIFALISCQNFRRRYFRIIIDIDSAPNI